MTQENGLPDKIYVCEEKYKYCNEISAVSDPYTYSHKAVYARTPVIPVADGMLSVDELFSGELEVTPERLITALREHIRMCLINKPTEAEIKEALEALEWFDFMLDSDAGFNDALSDKFDRIEAHNRIRSVLNKMRGV